jgi:hypothetical protein
MNGLMYTARFSSTESAAQDLLTIGPVVTPNWVIIHSIRIGQHTLAADANAEMAEIQIARAAAVGSVGSVITDTDIQAHMPGAPTLTTVVRTSDTTAAASPQIILSDSFNIQAGWLYLPTPEERVQMSSTAGYDVFVCTLPNGVTESGLTGSITFEEVLG